MIMNTDTINEYLDKLEEMDADQMSAKVDKYLDEEAVESICVHVEEFYGLDDDEQIGQLAQIMISGIILAKEIESSKLS